MVDVRYSVATEGQVTNLNFCHDEAPSTLDASYSSCGIARRAAIRIIVQNGKLFHTCTVIAIDNASQRTLSQLGPSSAVSTKISTYGASISAPHVRHGDRRLRDGATDSGPLGGSASVDISVCP